MLEQHRDHATFLQFEQYTRFPELIHGVFTRLGGYSQGSFTGLNVAFSSGDRYQDVLRNRFEVLRALGIEDYPCGTVWQIHGAKVERLRRKEWDDWQTDYPHRAYEYAGQTLTWTAHPRRKADAIITQEQGIALALAFADCVPLLFYDPAHRAIGIAHGGWRGTARGIVAATLEAMQSAFDSSPEDIYACVGPSIGGCCYEVTEQIRGLFLGTEQFEDEPTDRRYRELVRESAVFTTAKDEDTDSLRLDLQETNRRQLLLAGVPEAHIEMPEVCTSCDTTRFFSHRKEEGKTGRFPVILALRREEADRRTI